jgi:peptidoglycan/xylan/chitin deacetylase (PgdA/CDA1 family)
MNFASFRPIFYGAARDSGLTAFLRGKRRRCVPILFYHGVTQDAWDGIVNCERKHLSSGAFERQLQFISRNCRPVALSRLIGSLLGGPPLPDFSVVVTFDDGYEDNFSTAFPLLKKYGVPATFYLTADFILKREPLWFDRLEAAFASSDRKTWQEPFTRQDYALDSAQGRIRAYLRTKSELKRLPPDKHGEALESIIEDLGGLKKELPLLFSPMTLDHVRTLAQTGLIEIGSHACRHLPLTTLSHGEALIELVESKTRIEDITGSAVDAFSYPNGACSAAIKESAKKAGYTSAVTTALRLNRPGELDAFSLSRVAIAEADDDAEIAGTLCGLRETALALRGLLPT